MSKYELVLVVKAQSPQEEKENIFKHAADIVTKNGGKIINSQIWIEKQKMAFAIKRCLEATYYLIKFEGAGSIIEKVRQGIRLNEDILRSLISRVE